MTLDKKLMRNGNGWAIAINRTILKFLNINPEIDMVQCKIVNDELIIKKSDKQFIKT